MTDTDLRDEAYKAVAAIRAEIEQRKAIEADPAATRRLERALVALQAIVDEEEP